MIAELRGTILRIGRGFIVLDVGGIGYRVSVTGDALATLRGSVGEAAHLLTHLAVRENAHDLYGFLREEELNFFELLITISGIGPKTALAVLSVADPKTIARAVNSGDSSHLTKVSGIGRKSAERIVVELRDKLGALATGEETAALKDESDAIDALRALGYTTKEARDALKAVAKEVVGAGERVREALKSLST